MSFASLMLARRDDASFDLCKEVSAKCPVSATTLGYYPNKGANIFFVAGFFLSALVAASLGIWRRTWSFSAVVTAGCILEGAGYIGRVMLHNNPWDVSGFELQIVAIILSPTLLCVSIYLTLKHVCLAFNPSISRVKPRFYTYIFVPSDVSCLIVQAIGGGIAASAKDTNQALIDSGNRTIIAGIVLQVVVLVAFGIMASEYLIKLRKWLRGGDATADALSLWSNPKFKMFLYAVTCAYSVILIRCIYRIAEMAGGWGNVIMQDEPSFIVLESLMVLIGAALLAAFPPYIIQAHRANIQEKPKEETSEV